MYLIAVAPLLFVQEGGKSWIRQWLLFACHGSIVRLFLTKSTVQSTAVCLPGLPLDITSEDGREAPHATSSLWIFPISRNFLLMRLITEHNVFHVSSDFNIPTLCFLPRWLAWAFGMVGSGLLFSRNLGHLVIKCSTSSANNRQSITNQSLIRRPISDVIFSRMLMLQWSLMLKRCTSTHFNLKCNNAWLNLMRRGGMKTTLCHILPIRFFDWVTWWHHSQVIYY